MCSVWTLFDDGNTATQHLYLLQTAWLWCQVATGEEPGVQKAIHSDSRPVRLCLKFHSIHAAACVKSENFAFLVSKLVVLNTLLCVPRKTHGIVLNADASLVTELVALNTSFRCFTQNTRHSVGACQGNELTHVTCWGTFVHRVLRSLCHCGLILV